MMKEKEKKRVPQLRFPEFTDDWEQRKFADVVQIERGGSPRPIDDYITDSPNGLNWVKIGDAPAQGHYITKTDEKIRPQGLSKTREVHPGDLILSNSMSFGKPYIMGIDGCIHDGWLLIRDTNNTFDLTFLCHLLGTPQMLDQYRSLAAGSTVNNLNKELVGNTVVTIPKIDEQRVLGQYLERLDNLITLHQRKLEKLKKLKKGLVQKLFSQEVRFKADDGSEFPEWEEKKLGEFGTFIKGAALSKADISEYGSPFILYGELYTTYKEVAYNIQRRTQAIVDKKYYSCIGDVVIPTSGESAEEISTATCVMVPNVILGGDLNIFRSDIVDGRIMSYILNHQVKWKIAMIAQGKSIVHIQAKQLSNIYVKYPVSKVEQQKIADCLSLLDDVIEKQKVTLSAWEEMKKGLLQQMFV